MISIQEQANHAAQAIRAQGTKTLYLFPLKKRMNAQSNEFRLALFCNLLTTGRHYGESEQGTLDRLTRDIQGAGYTIQEVDPDEYVKKDYIQEIKRQTAKTPTRIAA